MKRRLLQARRITTAVLLVAAYLLAAGCATSPPEEPGMQQPPFMLPEIILEFAEPGDTAYEKVTRSFESTHGCTVTYDHYRPHSDAGRGETTVVLGHGFMRDREQTRLWAAHWASRGIPVANVSFCNSGWFNGFHGRNADDLAETARSLMEEGRAERIIYVGHSAGGLSALLATIRDPHAVAYLGLDTVDTGAALEEARASLGVPALFLLGEPAACNAGGNIVDTLPEGLVSDRGSMTMLRIHGASHCHFEWPSTVGCRLLCGRGPADPEGDRIEEVIRGLGTGWIALAAEAQPVPGTANASRRTAGRLPETGVPYGAIVEEAPGPRLSTALESLARRGMITILSTDAPALKPEADEAKLE